MQMVFDFGFDFIFSFCSSVRNNIKNFKKSAIIFPKIHKSQFTTYIKSNIPPSFPPPNLSLNHPPIELLFFFVFFFSFFCSFSFSLSSSNLYFSDVSSEEK